MYRCIPGLVTMVVLLAAIYSSPSALLRPDQRRLDRHPGNRGPLALAEGVKGGYGVKGAVVSGPALSQQQGRDASAKPIAEAPPSRGAKTPVIPHKETAHAAGTGMSNFEPKHVYSPLPGLTVQLFPPRIRGREGVSLSTKAEDPSGIVWDSSLGELRLTCKASQVKGRLELETVLRNVGKSDQEVAVRYPVVHYAFPDGSPVRVFDPVFGGVLEPKSHWQNSVYPGPASFCATFATGGDQAIGLAVRNRDQRRARIGHVPGFTHGQMGIELTQVLVRAGQTLELPSAYIAAGTDWAEILQPYRDWLLATFPSHVKLPAWYENGQFVNVWNAHCMAPVYPPPTAPGVWIFDPGFRRRTIEEARQDVDRGFEQAAKHGCKPVFYQFGWWGLMARFQGLLPFDAVCGDYTDAHRLARQTIQYIHSRGGRTFLYVNFISAGEESDVFREHPEAFVRDERGMPVRNGWYPMFLFCPGSTYMRTYWDRVLRHVLVELDADGIFLDQLGGGTEPPRCCDPRHRHEHPDTYGRDYLELLDYVRRKARQLKPDALIGCELPSDVRSMWIDQVHGQGCNRASEPASAKPEEVAARPPHEYLVFHAFVNPHAAMRPDDANLVAVGVPGLPDDPVYRRFRSVFRAGPRPCRTEPIGAMAYLFGPVDGQAILATRAGAELKDVKVRLPVPMAPTEGGTHVARAGADGAAVVDAGPNARFYRFAVPPGGRR